MSTVLTTSSNTSPLPGCWPGTHRAHLPICGKPIIVHQIERFSVRGLDSFIIPRGAGQAAMRARLGDGSEWGVHIRYSDLNLDELMATQRLNNAKMLLGFADTLDQDTFPIGCATKLESRFSVDSADSYHQTNLAAIRGDIDLTLPGRALHEFQAQCDWHTMIDSNAYVGGGVFIGKHCCIGFGSRLESDCILGNGVVVGEDCQLQNVTVLPNTYIKPGSRFQDAILCDGKVLSFNGDQRASDNLAASRSPDAQRTGLPTLLNT